MIRSTWRCSAVHCSVVQCGGGAVQCSAVDCSAVQFSALQSSALQWRCSAVQCSGLQLWCVPGSWSGFNPVLCNMFSGLPCCRGTLYQYWTTVQLAASHYSAPLTTFAPTGRDCGEAATTARTLAPDSRYMADLHSPVPTLYTATLAATLA